MASSFKVCFSLPSFIVASTVSYHRPHLHTCMMKRHHHIDCHKGFNMDFHTGQVLKPPLHFQVVPFHPLLSDVFPPPLQAAFGIGRLIPHADLEALSAP